MINHARNARAVGLLTVLLGLLLFCFAAPNSLRLLFSRDQPPTQDIFRFESSDTAPHYASIYPLQGTGIFYVQSDQQRYFMALAPQPGAWFGIVIPSGKRVYTALHITAYIQGSGTPDLYLETKAGKKVRLAFRRQLINRKFDLTPYLEPDTPQRLVLRVDGQKPGDLTTVQNLSLSQVPSATFFPRIDILLIGLLTALLIIDLLQKFGCSTVQMSVAALGILLFLFMGWSGLSLTAADRWLWTGLLAAVLVVRHYLARTANFKKFSNEFLLIPLAVALSLRWPQLAASVDVGLDWSDAQQYKDIALNFNPLHPFATSFREPMTIWIPYLTMKLLGPYNIHIRLPSLIASLAIVWATYHLAYDISQNKKIAWLAALAISFNDLLVYNSVLGGRNDLYTLMVLVFCWGVLVLPTESVRSEIGLAFLGGAMGLTWLVGVVGASLAYLWRWRKYRISVAKAALFFGIVGALLAPHLYYEWKTHGDPLEAINFTTNLYQHLKEGYTPNANETTWTHYLLKSMGLAQLTKNVVHGYASLLFNPNQRYNRILLGFHYSEPYSLFMYPFFLIGMLIDLLKRRWAGFFFLFCFLNITPAFVLETPHPRIFLHAAPFFAYFWGVGVYAVANVFVHFKNGVANGT